MLALWITAQGLFYLAYNSFIAWLACVTVARFLTRRTAYEYYYLDQGFEKLKEYRAIDFWIQLFLKLLFGFFLYDAFAISAKIYYQEATLSWCSCFLLLDSTVVVFLIRHSLDVRHFPWFITLPIVLNHLVFYLSNWYIVSKALGFGFFLSCLFAMFKTHYRPYCLMPPFKGISIWSKVYLISAFILYWLDCSELIRFKHYRSFLNLDINKLLNF